MNGWISVHNKLPEPETPVLAIVDGYDGILTLERRWETCNTMVESYFKPFLYWDCIDNDGQDFDSAVRYWMPMIAIPKKEQSKEDDCDLCDVFCDGWCKTYK